MVHPDLEEFWSLGRLVSVTKEETVQHGGWEPGPWSLSPRWEPGPAFYCPSYLRGNNYLSHGLVAMERDGAQITANPSKGLFLISRGPRCQIHRSPSAPRGGTGAWGTFSQSRRARGAAGLSSSSLWSPGPSGFKAGGHWTSAGRMRRKCLGEREHESGSCRPGLSKAHGPTTCPRPRRTFPPAAGTALGLCRQLPGRGRGSGTQLPVPSCLPKLVSLDA